MNCLIIQPDGGLANRLMVLLSGIRISRLLNRRLVVQWPHNETLNCRLDEIFLTKFDHDNSIDEDRITHHDPSGGILFINDEDFIGKDVYVKAHHFFYISSDAKKTRQMLGLEMRDIFWSLQLAPYIVEQVALHQQGLQNGLGIHIRRSISIEMNKPDVHAHAVSNKIWAFPDDTSYVMLAKTLLEKFGLTGSIFVSTVSDTSRACLIEHLGAERVKYFPARSYAHDSELAAIQSAAIQDALIDMILLSQTRMVTRRFPSTFSYLAAIFGGCFQTVIYDNGQLVVKEPFEW